MGLLLKEILNSRSLGLPRLRLSYYKSSVFLVGRLPNQVNFIGLTREVVFITYQTLVCMKLFRELFLLEKLETAAFLVFREYFCLASWHRSSVQTA